MRIKFQKSFTKQFTRLSEMQKQMVKNAIQIFEEDPTHDSLRNHPLKDKWANYRSITADDDLRMHYRIINEDIVLFVAVGTHDQLYR